MSGTRNLATTPLLQSSQTPEVNLLAVFLQNGHGIKSSSKFVSQCP